MPTTPNYAWPTPANTDLVKDGAAAIRNLGDAIDTTTKSVSDVANAAIPKTLVDAKGDLIVGTADNTVTRLALGTNNHVLTADSAATGGVKWAAVSAPVGALAQIATGTLSGASVTISSLSSYDKLLLVMYGITFGTGANEVLVLINNDATGIYRHEGSDARANGATFISLNRINADWSAVQVFGSAVAENASGTNAVALTLTNCSSASGYTQFAVNSHTNLATGAAGVNFSGIYKANGAVSSLVIKTQNNYSFTAGTYYLYGA